MTEKRISLWSGPRNVSTALMYSFAQRPDTAVVDEPLYGHYLRVSGAQHPGRKEVMEVMELEGSRVVDQMLGHDFQRPVLFMKNMAHHLVELELDFLDQLENVLLIRDPQEMLPSLINQIPSPVLRDTGLEVQWELFKRFQQKGQTPMILDSRELLLDPEGVLNQVCQRLQLPFFPSMIHWEPGPRTEDGIWAKHWYHNVHKSTGFIEYRPKQESVPKGLEGLLEECQEYYQLLYAHAIRAST